ncbi:immunoglobulin lambda-1 light chain-like [Notolabrus celidotus]|uniref:immunoglobulin lambda-1 light chain-like n=1 Tax=Notolabrus celidotus TaxID=1203425 RepID=UPI00148F6AC8|nr:immunoglobulin lambda-1 light chain-like [Notolabrus celidotus]
MELKYDPGSSSDSFSSTQVFVSLFLTVGGGGYFFMFGSGTKLFVTDEPVVKPVVSVYPAASRAQLERKSSLLCVASDMFPPLVQISWRRPKGDGQLEVLPPAEGEQLELRESGRSVSILIVPQRENRTDRYLCSVQHEGGRVDARTEQEVPAAAASCPPEREAPDLTALQQTQMSFQAQCRVKLLSLLYSLLILKSLVFCCGLSLLRIPTNKPPSISCTCADRLSPAGLFSPSDLSSSPLESFSQQVQM